MGVNLSTVTHTNLNIDNSPLFYTNSIISDTINWITISGSFIADSAYQYLMIGNFFDDANTTVVNNGIGPYAYYLIDDVCLSTDSLLCANFSATVEENNIKNQFTFYPNPANSFVTIGNNSHITFDIEIYNALGQRLYEEKNTTTNAKTIDTSPFNNGILFINITSKNQSINYKLLKQ